MRRVFYVALIIGLSIVGTVFAQQTLRIPDQYDTIQAAIDAAQPGDTIEVHGGTYTNSVILTKSINIVGIADANGVPIFQPDSWEDPIIAISDDALGVVIRIDSVIFSGAWGEGAIILQNDAVLNPTNCTFEDNYIAISATASSKVVLKDCSVNHNDGSAIYVGDSTTLDIESCSFVGNGTSVMADGNATVEIASTAFKGIVDTGILLSGNSEYQVASCTFTDMIGSPGPKAIVADGASSGVVDKSYFSATEEPEKYQDGPGAYFPIGGAVLVAGTASITVSNCEMRNVDPAVFVRGGATVLIKDNTVLNGICAWLWGCEDAQVTVLGNTVGGIGEHSTWCTLLVSLWGRINTPVEISNNTIGDTGGCLAFHLRKKPCDSGATEGDEFFGMVTGSGNHFTKDYTHGTRQCPSWRSPFWPKDFATFED